MSVVAWKDGCLEIFFCIGKLSVIFFFNLSLVMGFIELVVWTGKEVVGMHAFNHSSEGKLTVLHNSS